MSPPQRQVVLVTGANGYIGSAVARAFVRAGHYTYGLVRRESSMPELETGEVIPILGSPNNVADWAGDLKMGPPQVIVSTTEDVRNYEVHYNEVVAMLRYLSTEQGSTPASIRPLVLFTSGCKDYGRTGLDGSPDLQPSREVNPLSPPPFAQNRARLSNTIFNHVDVFDPVLLRPTTVYGLTSSYYSDAFVRAETASQQNTSLIIPSRKDSIMHGCHVDDCAEAYVCLAEHPNRSDITGQSFNISASEYETAGDVATAIAKQYGIDKVLFQPEEGTEDTNFKNMLFAFSQWVSSEKIRKVVGWKDRRPLFQDNVGAYRRAFEANRDQGHESVLRAQQKLQGR